MPVQTPQWTEFLSCPICYNEFETSVRRPISLGCGHTVCRHCLFKLQRKQCPFDQTPIHTDVVLLPENTAILQLVNGGFVPDSSATPLVVVPKEAVKQYKIATKCIEELALFLKPSGNGPAGGSGNISQSNLNCISLSRPMQRKLVTLINCQLVEEEGRLRALRATRSLGERSVTELILQHQNAQQLSANLWAAVRARGCQFLGPAMQEEVLKLVLLALEDGSALSRKVLVMYVVQRLAPHFPQASKTSIGHVVQLLYRASCFKVSKRDGDSSLMQLKEEFRTYEALRREHDAQIVQIATEAGLRIAPEQWSSLLYGDTSHKSHMQSIIDKLQTPQSFAQSVQELVIALQRTGDPGNLSILRPHLELLAAIDPSPDVPIPPTWLEVSQSTEAAKAVVKGLVEFIHNFGNRKLHEDKQILNVKYKTNLCRDLAQRLSCPRGANCTFAHSQEEMEKYRAKTKRVLPRSSGNAGGSSPGSQEGSPGQREKELSPSSNGSGNQAEFSANSANSRLSDDEGGGPSKDGNVSGYGMGNHYVLDDQGGKNASFCQAIGESAISANGIHHHHHHHYHHTKNPFIDHALNPDSPPFQPVAITSPTLGRPLIGVIPGAGLAVPCGQIQNISNTCPRRMPLGTSLSCNNMEIRSGATFKHAPISRKHSEGQTPSKVPLQSASLHSLQQRKRKLLAQLERLQENHLSMTISGGLAQSQSTNTTAEMRMTLSESFYSPWTTSDLFNCVSSTERLEKENDDESDGGSETGVEDVHSTKQKESANKGKKKGGRFTPSEIDEFIPFDPPLVSKYGPISRSAARLAYLRGCPAPIQVNAVSQMGELTNPTSVVRHPLSSTSATPSMFMAAGSTTPTQNYAVPVALIPTAAVGAEQILSVMDQSQVVLPIAMPINNALKNQLPDYHPEIKMEIDELRNQMSSQCQLVSGDEMSLQEELWAIEQTIQQKEFLISKEANQSDIFSSKEVRPVPTSVGPWQLHQLEMNDFVHKELDGSLIKDLEDAESGGHWLKDFDQFDTEDHDIDSNDESDIQVGIKEDFKSTVEA